MIAVKVAQRAFVGASIILAGIVAGSASSQALDRGDCKWGRTVVFRVDANLTDNNKRTVCSVKAGQKATARSLGSSRRNCKVQAWGRCRESDIGWTSLEKLRRPR